MRKPRVIEWSSKSTILRGESWTCNVYRISNTARVGPVHIAQKDIRRVAAWLLKAADWLEGGK